MELSCFSGHFYYQVAGEVLKVYEIKDRIKHRVVAYDPVTGRETEVSEFFSYRYQLVGERPLGDG